MDRGRSRDDVPLPPELAREFTVHRRLSVHGTGESEILAEVDEGRSLLKVYREGFTTDPEVRSRWRKLRHDGVVRLKKSGQAGNRRWELMANVPGPTLRRLMEDSPKGLEAEAVEEAVGQLAAVLDALGKQQIAHLDVRPENIVVASTEPLRLVLVDFGVSRYLRQERMFRVHGSTPAYAAPEVHGRTATPVSDSWSLGVLAAELATGRHPLGSSNDIVQYRMSQGRQVPVQDLPARLRPLVEGLTRRQHENRWTAAKATEWLARDVADRITAGEAVTDREAVSDTPTAGQPDSAGVVSVAQPFTFLDRRYDTRAALAEALRQHWDAAAQQLFASVEGVPSRWPELRTWLQQFPPERQAGGGSEVITCVETRSTGPDSWPPHALLLLLECQLDPWTPPEYRCQPLCRGVLRRLAQYMIGADQEGAGPAGIGLWKPEDSHVDLLEDLWRHPLLPLVDGYPYTDGFTALDARWRELEQRWRFWRDRLRSESRWVDETFTNWDGSPVLHAHLLLLALDPPDHPEHAAALAADVAGTRAMIGQDRLDGALDWFETVAVPQKGLGCLIGFAAGRVAREQARAEQERREERRSNDAWRQFLWRRWEFWRKLDRSLALGWAAAALALLTLAWTGAVLLADFAPFAGPSAVTRAWAFAAIGLIAQLVVEGWLSVSIGGPYHPSYSLMTSMIHAGGWIGDFFRRSWRRALLALLLGIGVLAAAAGLVLVAPFLLTATVPALHLVDARHRYQRWCAEHRRRRQELVPEVPSGVAA
jgi:serine/threonine protein kinase